MCLSPHVFSLQGYPGEKGNAGSSDIIDFNGKLLDAFQVSDVRPQVCLFACLFVCLNSGIYLSLKLDIVE